MDKETNYSENKDDTKKLSGKRNHTIGKNMIEWGKRTRSIQGIRKERQTIMERRWNHLCE